MTFDWEAARQQVRRASDLHTIRASMLFDCPYECVTPKQRIYAKTVNFVEFYTPGFLSNGRELWGKLCVYEPWQPPGPEFYWRKWP